ncbi:MAG TPA: VOC family protein [Hyphomicrobiales bacterium]|nr:VOC family protein [Hyphomicrobiales bacterium]
MEPRINVVTLGVRDLAAATAFYERLGFTRSKGASSEGVSFFPLGGGGVLALFGHDALAEDAALSPEGSGFRAISLARNARSEAEADALVDAFVAAGGRLVKRPSKVFWGGYSGYVADPDGHLWEIAFNPHWPLDADGRIHLPP